MVSFAQKPTLCKLTLLTYKAQGRTKGKGYLIFYFLGVCIMVWVLFLWWNTQSWTDTLKTYFKLWCSRNIKYSPWEPFIILPVVFMESSLVRRQSYYKSCELIPSFIRPYSILLTSWLHSNLGGAGCWNKGLESQTRDQKQKWPSCEGRLN